jgi:hypothetical protein
MTDQAGQTIGGEESDTSDASSRWRDLPTAFESLAGGSPFRRS